MFFNCGGRWGIQHAMVSRFFLLVGWNRTDSWSRRLWLLVDCCEIEIDFERQHNDFTATRWGYMILNINPDDFSKFKNIIRFDECVEDGYGIVMSAAERHFNGSTRPMEIAKHALPHRPTAASLRLLAAVDEK